MPSPVFTRNEKFNRSVNPPAQFGNPSDPSNAPKPPDLYNVDRGISVPSNNDVMTFENSMSKIIGLFVIVMVTAAVGWYIPVLALPAVLIGLVLGLVNSFRKEPSVPLIVAYAGFEGLFVGGISRILDDAYPGIAVQAVLATFCVIGVTLFLFKTGKIRASAKMTKIFIIATSAYLLFSLINLGMMLFGATDSAWGLRTDVEIFGIPLGIVIGLFAVLLGAYSLVLDFTFIEQGIHNRIPERYGWTAAFGVVVTVVWIYVELLRIMAILRGR